MPPLLNSNSGYIHEPIDTNYGKTNSVSGDVNTLLNKKQDISTLIQEAYYVTETVYGENGPVFHELLFRPADDAGEIITGDEMQLILQEIRNLGLTFHLFSKNIDISREEIKSSKNKKIMSINAFPEDLGHPDFVDTLNKKYDEYGIPHENIVIEILEYDWGNNQESILKNLKLLQKHKYKIALDDLVLNSKGFHLHDNENYSFEILSMLIQHGINLDYIKIYGGFLKYLSKLPLEHHDLIEGKEELSQILQDFETPPDLIAEWVATSSDIQTALDIGCSCFQGRELSKGVSEPLQKIHKSNIEKLKKEPKASL